jgi:small-conductance mechanosensitive channel
MNELSDLLALEFFGNSVFRWSLAGLAFLVTFTVLPLLRGYIAALRKRYAVGPHATAVEVSSLLADRTKVWFLWAVAFWFAAVRVLEIPERVELGLNRLMVVLLALQVGIWLSAAVSFRLHHRRGATIESDPTGALAIVNFVAAILIWSVVTLVALDNLGVNVTALIAGLGIGGIAVALAVQTTLSNLLGSLAIALDQPFVVGDTIAVDQDTGRVEKIGITSTRLRSLSGEQIVISNSDLLSSRVRNYGRMNERRVVFGTRLTYETPLELLEQVPGLIRSIIESQSATRFDRSHFAKHAPDAIEYETVYYVLSPDYNIYMDIQQAINVTLHRELQQRGIRFAYPTQRLFVMPQDAEPGRPVHPSAQSAA